MKNQVSWDEEDKPDSELADAVANIQKVRKEVEEAAHRLHTLTSDLRIAVRRSGADNASLYMLFCTAHLRFAAALSNGLRRTAAFDRMISNNHKERAEKSRLEKEAQERQSKEFREQSKKIERMLFPSEDDVDTLFEVSHE